MKEKISEEFDAKSTNKTKRYPFWNYKHDIKEGTAATSEKPEKQDHELYDVSLKIRGFCKGVGEIEWLLLISLLLYLYLSEGKSKINGVVVVGLCAYLIFSLGIDRIKSWGKYQRWGFALRTWVMIGFTTWFIIQTSANIVTVGSLYILPIIISALTLGETSTVLEVAAVAACYLYLLFQANPSFRFNPHELANAGSNIVLFLLTGYLSTVLAEVLRKDGMQKKVIQYKNQEIKASQERLDYVIQQSADAYIEIDGSGRILRWNKSATRTLGWSRNEVIGEKFIDLVVPPPVSACP